MTDLDPIHVRKKFEAAMSNLAKEKGCEPRDYRQGFKDALVLNNLIHESTNEMQPYELDRMADRMNKEARDLAMPPTPESEHCDIIDMTCVYPNEERTTETYEMHEDKPWVLITDKL